jgi:uncharacterized membrane protein
MAHNPYAPSRATLNVSDNPASSTGVRREGKWIVMPLDAELPHRCVKCNAAPDEPTKRRTVYWHHPAVYLVLLINLIIYAIVAAVVRKQVKISPALCSAHKAKRRNAILLAWGGVAAAILLPIAFGSEEYAGVWLLFCIVLFLVSCISGIVRSRILYGKRIDADEAKLGGAGPEFLDSLPD